MQILYVYWGCALTHAPEEYLALMNQVIVFIKNYHPQVKLMEFLGTTAGTDRDVYWEDIEKNVSSCDLFLNDVSLPSLGLGFELGCSVKHYKKNTVSFIHEKILLTRLLLGAAEENEHYTILQYQNKKDLIEMISTILNEKIENLNKE